MRILHRWHDDLLLVIVPHVRAQMKKVLAGQWEITGYAVFAGNGSRIELACTQSLAEINHEDQA